MVSETIMQPIPLLPGSERVKFKNYEPISARLSCNLGHCLNMGAISMKILTFYGWNMR